MTIKKLAIILNIFLVVNFAQATCYEQMEDNTPTIRYIFSDDGWVTDKKTNLMWMRCSLGQTWENNTCTGQEIYTFENSLIISNEATFAGFDDWRLPNIKELISIVANNCNRPAINLDAFPGTTDSIINSFWSATKTNDNSSAWSLDFAEGTPRVITVSAYYQVRLVRDLSN
ncbi:DUF1566 domain-containing protein [Marinicellulosiphila megalodicopiae]|uniref:Lcl C-terminal domain-containing protein n=1 Tax=Marinicellulosiphila megalodicopiae TaxID=2724896 RepID=UPI003BAEEA50